jgi:hypothetical protein
MSDTIKARVRTWWPLIVGHLAAWLLIRAAPLLDWLAGLGIVVTDAEVAVVVGLVLAGAVWETARWLERRTGPGRWARVARAIGRWLISLGLHTGAPAYPDQAIPWTHRRR